MQRAGPASHEWIIGLIVVDEQRQNYGERKLGGLKLIVLARGAQFQRSRAGLHDNRRSLADSQLVACLQTSERQLDRLPRLLDIIEQETQPFVTLFLTGVRRV